MTARAHRLPDPAWRQTAREIDQSDYDWQQEQLRDDDGPHCDVCQVEGCENQVLIKSRQLCRTHYQRFRKTGNPLLGRRDVYWSLNSWTERFWSNVDKSTDCWMWIAAKNDRGYGQFTSRMEPHNTIYAHRVAYELQHGSIPEGLELDHLCRHPACVNPDHLEAVSHVVNCRRGSRPMQTHCKHGHEFTPENTYVKPNGHRFCKECKRTRDRDRSLWARCSTCGGADFDGDECVRCLARTWPR